MYVMTPPERPPLLHSGDERAQLGSWLDFMRATLLLKCAGLTMEQLRQRHLATSELTLLGILRHMAAVEQYWFESVLEDRDVTWYIDAEEDPDADFHDLDGLPLAEVESLFLQACEISRDIVANRSLDDLSRNQDAERGGRTVDTRWVLVHMIEEYARHLGHADFLREMTDGATGY